ncbi:MAG: NAD(P)-dependent oxidoreductase [Ramlibacter sp.]|nr:NAD(P)-dependent oxidoreductase [Ramlibacter sp.]
MAKLFIAGGTGLIGSELVRQAAGAGHDVTLLCRQVPVEGQRFVVADLGDPQSLPGRLPQERFDAVLYLAQAAEHNAFPDNAGPAVALNIASPVALCQWAVRTGCRQFIYASSGGICGPGGGPQQRIGEEWPRQGAANLSFYLSTKARCEELLLSFAPQLQLDFLRYFFVYGPGQRSAFLFPRLAQKVRAGQPIELAGGTGPLLNPIHATDAAALTLAALGTHGDAVTNVAGAEDTTLLDVIRGMEQAIGRAAVINATAGPAPVYLADTARMKRRLGWPRVPLAQGLPSALQALRL